MGRRLTPDEAHQAFDSLHSARHREMSGWVQVAKWLAEVEGSDWWRYYGENEIEVLAMPEFQIPKTTASQYRRVYKCFGLLDEELLSHVRPRLLYQACDAVEAGANPEEVIDDAMMLSWSSFVHKWNPKKSPFSLSIKDREREKGEEDK